jgi:type II secretory pathway pseudopilin PulG
MSFSLGCCAESQHRSEKTTPSGGFTLLELVLTAGLLGVLASFSLTSTRTLQVFSLPWEKLDCLQRVRQAQFNSILHQRPGKVTFGNRTLQFGVAGRPMIGSNGTFPIKGKSGRSIQLVISSMGRTRIQ